MHDMNALLKIFDAYVAHTGLAEMTVSTRFLGRGTRVAELRNGGDMGSRTIRRIIDSFAAGWPEGAAWPDGVDRPVTQAEAAQ